MANIRSSTSRLILNITTSSPAVEWPNYGSVMHQAYLGKVVAYGHELGGAASVPNPHRGTDIRPAGGVKQNIASFTWSRYANAYTSEDYYKEVYKGGKNDNVSYRRYTNYRPHITEHTVEHWADTPSNLLGFCVDFFSLYRASHQHEWFAATYITAVLYYRTASNSNLQTLNYGQVFSWWTGDGNNHKAFERSLGDASGFTYAKLVVRVYHGMGNWHDSGDRSPANWSPDVPVCNPAHAVGISSNYWRSITNAGWGAAPTVDRATVYYKPNQTQVNLPKKHFSASKIEAGNGTWSKIGEYSCPWFNGGLPPFYTPPPPSSGSSSGNTGSDSGHNGNRP